MAYKWFFNGTELPGTIDSTLTLPNITKADEGDYHAEVSSDAGTTVSLNAHLTVQAMVNIPLELSSLTVTEGGISFTATGPLNADYVIWTSLDLLVWEPIQTNHVVDGMLMFTDPSPTQGSRFHRATATR